MARELEDGDDRDRAYDRDASGGRRTSFVTAPCLFGSARQPEPSALVLNEPSCYHFRELDPRVFAILSATMAAVTIGRCYHV